MHAPAPGDSRALGQVGEGPVPVGKERAGGHARRWRSASRGMGPRCGVPALRERRLVGRARPLAARCPGRAPARVRAECASSGCAELRRLLSGAARGGRDRGRGVPGQAGPAAASCCRVFFGKLRLFLPLSGLRPKGADESPRRAQFTLRGSPRRGLRLGAVVGDRTGT